MTALDIEIYARRMEELMEAFSKITQKVNPIDMKSLDITLPQFMVMKYLSRNDNCRMSDLSDAMSVTMGNMTGMVDRLVREGYVKRSEDPEDRRIVRVVLTKKGKDAAARISEHRIKGIMHMFAVLSEGEIRTLFSIMEKIAKGRVK